MSSEKNIRRDQALELAMGNLLRIGVILSAAIVVVGGILDLLTDAWTVPNFLLYHGEPAYLKTLSGIVHASLRFEGRGLIQLGLLVLIATPIARVVFSLFSFARQRDYLYVWISFIVLALLIIGLVGTGK